MREPEVSRQKAEGRRGAKPWLKKDGLPRMNLMKHTRLNPDELDVNYSSEQLLPSAFWLLATDYPLHADPTAVSDSP